MASSSGEVAASRVDQVVPWSRPTQVAPICLKEAIVRLVRVKKAPAQPGKAVQAKWTTRHELAKLRALIVKARKQGDLRTWRRGKAGRDYINGKKVLAIAAEFGGARAAGNPWVRGCGTEGAGAPWPPRT